MLTDASGAVGNFTHILEYEGYAGYDETRRTSLKHPVSIPHHTTHTVLNSDTHHRSFRRRSRT